MYTIIWRDPEGDCWDRLETKEEVLELLQRLTENGDVCIGDVWIFDPEADEHVTTGDNWLPEEEDDV